MAVERLFFQSSLPRAGSTMLQNIMAQNPDFYCTPTDGTLELIFGARANYTESPEFKAQDAATMKKGFMSFCKDGLFGFYSAITDKKYALTKSRGWTIHYDFVNSFYPNPKMICMVRDLRDIICSMEKKFRANPERQDPILNWGKMTGTNTPKRVDEWLSTPPVGLALERLQETIRQGIDKNILYIKYEDLTLYPEKAMERIYNYLELPHFTHDFDNIEQVTSEDDSLYGIYGDHVIRRKLEPLKSDAVRVLGRDVCDWLMSDRFAWYNNRFHYTK